MPYDALDYQHVLWENGKPYWASAGGKKTFIPPLTAAQLQDDPRAQAWAKSMGVSIDYQKDPTTGQTSVGPGGVTNTAAPGGSLLHQRGEWNAEKGQFDRPINWGNIMSMGVGGAMAAPFVAGALGAGAAGGAGGGSAAGGAVGSTAAASAAPAAASTIAGGGAAAATGGGMAAGGGAYLEAAKLGLGAVGAYKSSKAQQDAEQRRLVLEAMALENQNENNRATFNRQNPGVQMGNSVRGDILANVQPASFTGSGRDLKRQGGLSPALFSDNTRQLGALSSRQALLAAMGQEDSNGKIGGVTNPYSSPKRLPLELLLGGKY